MNATTPVEKIRLVVAQQLSQFGATGTDSVGESILIRNGLFCGRKFQCSGYHVVWFIEEDEIKFFSPCGDLLKSTSAIACIHAFEAQVDSQLDSAPIVLERRRAA
ncbi:MAG: hypothetical protein ABI557_03020 [Aureliella sp.]